MHDTLCEGVPRFGRRSFIPVAGACLFASSAALAGQDRLPSSASSDCPRCRGLGLIPTKDAKPWVWLKGSPIPRGDAMLGEQSCPVCHAGPPASELSAKFKEQIETALERNKTWEERTGWKLQCVVTRHATVQTQLSASLAMRSKR
jgi:hypothetical protein